MPLDRDLLDAVRELDEHELRRLLILAQTRLHQTGVLQPDTKVSLRQQMVKCGRDSCTTCPHGPYWYAYWREDGKRRSKYVGKLLDEE